MRAAGSQHEEAAAGSAPPRIHRRLPHSRCTPSDQSACHVHLGSLYTWRDLLIRAFSSVPSEESLAVVPVVKIGTALLTPRPGSQTRIQSDKRPAPLISHGVCDERPFSAHLSSCCVRTQKKGQMLRMPTKS
jgi:hypothetical protein